MADEYVDDNMNMWRISTKHRRLYGPQIQSPVRDTLRKIVSNWHLPVRKVTAEIIYVARQGSYQPRTFGHDFCRALDGEASSERAKRIGG